MSGPASQTSGIARSVSEPSIQVTISGGERVRREIEHQRSARWRTRDRDAGEDQGDRPPPAPASNCTRMVAIAPPVGAASGNAKERPRRGRNRARSPPRARRCPRCRAARARPAGCAGSPAGPRPRRRGRAPISRPSSARGRRISRITMPKRPSPLASARRLAPIPAAAGPINNETRNSTRTGTASPASVRRSRRITGPLGPQLGHRLRGERRAAGPEIVGNLGLLRAEPAQGGMVIEQALRQGGARIALAEDQQIRRVEHEPVRAAAARARQDPARPRIARSRRP